MKDLKEREYTVSADILKDVFAMLDDHPDAKLMLKTYCNYCHDVDDIIDEKKIDSEHVLKTQAMMSDILNSDFWVKNAHFLYIVEALINNDYADSNILMNKPKDSPEYQQGDVLRCSGNLMIFAVILLTKGRDALRKVSLAIREASYKAHHDKETGEAV